MIVRLGSRWRQNGVARERPLLDPAVRSVALVRLRVGLGDLLASAPALRALRAARPDLHVALITWPEMGDVLARQSAYVDELIAFPGYPGIPERPPQLAQVGPFFDAMRARRFDLALQMYGWQAAASEVTARLGARVTGGFFTPGLWEGDRATHLAYPHHLHEIHRHLALMEHLGVDWDSDCLEFPVSGADEQERDRLLGRHGLTPGRYVCIHAGATAPSRRWMPARFAAVADALGRGGWQVVLTGVTEERDIVAVIARAMTMPVVDLCGQTSLGGLAALLKSSALVVGNDSGPAQLAVALGVPSVTVFLAGDPLRWRGLDEDRHRVVRAGVACQPCGHLDCPIDFRCANELSAEEVIGEATGLLYASLVAAR